MELDCPRPGFGPSDLANYRSAVASLVGEIELKSATGDLSEIEALVADRLAAPSFRPVLECVGGRTGGAVERLMDEVRRYRPSTRSSASDLPSLVRITLLSQIDTAWWPGATTFDTDHQVHTSPELVSLEILRRRRLLRFDYRVQSDGLVGRAWDWAQRRLAPERRPHTAGIRFVNARPELVALLNGLADDFAAAAPRDTPRLWVTSLTRSVAHQRHLRDLGYAAMLPSAHCVGYAADVEMRWFATFGADRALTELLRERQNAGLCNVIDEGQAWHLCISPEAAPALRHSFDQLVAD